MTDLTTRPPKAPSAVITPRRGRRRGAVLGTAWATIAIGGPFYLDAFTLTLVMNVLTLGLLAASLDFLVGRVGIVSLGHAAFFALGGYAAALVATDLTANVFVQMTVAVVVAALVAAATGWIVVRSRGVFLLMLTLAIAQITYSAAESWTSVTGGSNGLSGIPHPTLLDDGVGVLETEVQTYWYLAIAVSVAMWALLAVTRSPFGAVLRGIRDNEDRMRAIGYPTVRYKVAAFTIAGAFAGASGSLAVTSRRFFSPSDASFELSVLVLVMVIIGGVGTIWGGFVGALVVVLVQDKLSAYVTGHGLLLLGIIFVLVVYLAPKGVLGLGKSFSSRQRRQSTSTEEGTVS